MTDIFDDIAALPTEDIFDQVDIEPIEEKPSLKLVPPSKEPLGAVDARIPKWDDVKVKMPDDMQEKHGEQVRNSLSVAASNDIPASQAFDMHDGFVEAYEEPNLWEKAQGSFKAGIGDVYATGGHALKWAGVSDEITNTYIDFGERLRSAYIPPMDQSEFTWNKLADPEWWATTGTRSVPFMLSLIPAAVIGAYGGAAVAGGTAVTLGLGTFGTTVLTALGGATGAAALSRPIESALEAGGVYEQGLQKGMNKEEADEAANEAFWGNMKLVGLDAAQFAVAFTPLNKIGGASALKAMRVRKLATIPLRLGVVGVTEAGEERFQETISRLALDEPVDFFDFTDPQLNEASVIGAIFGMGIGGAGTVWQGLTTQVVENMDAELKNTYETTKQDALDDGVGEEAAEIQALDVIAETPEGQTHIEETMKDLIEIGEGGEVEDAADKVASLREIFAKKEGLEPEAEISEITPEEIARDEAVIDLVIEGKDLDAITDEEVAARLTPKEPWQMTRDDYVKKEPLPQKGLFEPGMEFEDTGKNISAVKLDDGTIYYDTEAIIHADLIDNLKIPAERIVEGGFIVAGEYVAGGADAARIGGQNLAKRRVEHARSVGKALEEGKDVPAEVLADYPDLAPKEPIHADLSTPEGIAESLGITYNGIQEGAGNIPDNYLFTDNVTGTTFGTETLGEVETRLQEKRVEFGVEEPPVVEEAPAIETPEFKAWFGESQVVDEAGKPLVMYHGSGVSGMRELDPSKAGSIKVSDWGAGIYFTPSPVTADWYRKDALLANDPVGIKLLEAYRKEAKKLGTTPLSEGLDLGVGSPEYKYLKGLWKTYEEHMDMIKEGSGGEVYPVFISMKNPMIYEYQGITEPDLSMEAEAKGHDGIIIVNEPVEGSLSDYINEVIAFKPEQIKSIHDTAFDPADKRFISTEAYEAAQARIKEKLKGLKAGVDPTIVPDMIITGAYHIETGLRTFKAWSGKMIEEYGEKIRPVLKDLWKQSNGYLKPKKIPTAKVKGEIRRATGLQETQRMISEDKALSAAFKKAEQSARKAFKAGKEAEAAVQKEKMQGIILKANEKIENIRTEKQKMAKRRQTINTIKSYLGLTDTQMKGLTERRNVGNMTDYEFKKFKDDLLFRAEEAMETSFEKARVMEIIQRKRLEKVENYQRSLKLPPISKMNSKQLNEFVELLEPFEDADVFLTPRELETVDRTDLKGIRTWREAKAALAKEAGVPIEDLEAIKVHWTDKFKWDNALAESNPFYKLIVTEINKKLLEAEARVHEIEDKVFELAKKSEKSRGRSITRKLIPQDAQIMAYLEASKDDKPSIAKEMTPEQLDLAHYMQEYFGQALEYLIQTKSLDKGRENYFVHMRRSFLETFKDDGLLKAVMSVFENYQLEEMVFNILDGDTGNILPLEKFFQFSLRRTGTLTPTQNVVKAFLAYSKTFEKKVTLDETIPKLDIYAQSLTPRHYTSRGLEIDRSIKKFVYQYVNTKKGRHIDLGFVKQGDKVDLAIRGLRTFTTILDLGASIPVGIASFVGEQAANFTMLGEKGWVLGTARARTKKGKAILKKYESFVGRSVWEEFTQPGKEIGERVIEGMFGFFHQATVTANKQFLLASLSKEEYDSGVINEERLAQIRIEQGRFRAVPGAKSLVGSTSPGGAAVQYKGWAVPIMRTVSKDLATLASDLRKKPAGEALTSREARELFRATRMTLAVLLVLGLGDKEDKSFTGQLMYKIRREALTVLQAISPDMWLSTPRLVGFASKLGKNLKSLILLEEYKTKPGLKGAGGLKRQFTPGVVRPFKKDDKKGKLKFGK